jgi:hypothetical protein
MKTNLFYKPPFIYVNFFFRDLINSISTFISPRQNWLVRKIPKTWTDKDELMRICLFESLIHFVEIEEGVKMFRDSDWTDDIKKGYVTKKYAADHIKWCKKALRLYNYIINERPAIVSKYEQDYSIEVEEDLFKKDTDAMIDIVKLRGVMWT